MTAVSLGISAFAVLVASEIPVGVNSDTAPDDVALILVTLVGLLDWEDINDNEDELDVLLLMVHI